MLGLFLSLSACGGGGGTSASTSSGGGGGGGAVADSPTSMSVGDATYTDLSSGSGSVSLPSSGKFEVLLQSHSTGSSSNSFTLSSVSASGKALGLSDVESDLSLADSVVTPQELLDDLLREEENLNAFYGGAGKSLSSAKSASKGVNSDVSEAISKDSTANFSVLSSLSNTSSCVTITATAKYVGTDVAIYVDNEILSGNPGDLSQSDVDALGAIYDRELPNERTWYGSYSDIDKNGVAIALITSRVNRLGGTGGIVTGFFNSNDFSAGTCSNEAEIVYLVSPDSGGLYGTKISNSFFMSNFGPAVFFHEMLHLILHYQKVVTLGGASEKSCLNEGLAHLTEDLVGYNRENYSRYDLFLDSPQSYSACSATSLAGRGAAYLFLRYLYERSGESKTFLKNMVQTTNTGYDNILAAFPSASKSSDLDSIAEFLRGWGVALAYTNRISTSAKFKYNDRVKNATTSNWEGVCIVCSTEDGRGTTLTGPAYGTYSAGSSYSVKDATTRFLKLSSNPSTISFSVGSSSNGYGVVLRTE